METFCSSNSVFSGISKSYLEDEAFRKQFYSYNPDSEQDWNLRLKDVKSYTYQRKQLYNALYVLNKNLGASDATLNNIESLKKESTFCVVTGQQTGILGGPLYSIYKAATTIKKSKDLSRLLDVDVVPVFWMASEDHDFEEARVVSIVDDNKLKKVMVDKKPGLGQNNPYKTSHNYSYIKEPVGWIDVNTSVKSLMIEARYAWKDSKFKDWCHEVFEATIRENESLSDWFGRMYLKIFEDEGLILIDPMDEAVRKLGTAFLQEAISKSDDIINAVEEAGTALEDLGYSPLIESRLGATGLYYLERGERIPIIHEEGLYTIRENDERQAFSLSELKTRMGSHPEEFSTNVILRPVIQDVYLPTLAYVAGPGEASYYAQLKSVYSFFNMHMPMILVRENYTVVGEKLGFNLESLNLEVDEILNKDQFEIERFILNASDPMDVDHLFDEFQKDFNKQYELLVKKLESIDSDILEISDKNKDLITRQFDYLKQKSHRFHRRNHKEELKTVKKIYDWIKPYGGLQERTLSPLNVLSLAGPEFIHYIVNELEYDKKHRVIIVK